MELSNSDLNKRAIKAGLFFTICQFFVRGLSFLVTPLYSRILTTEQFGTVKIYESWLVILVPVVTLGLYRSIEVAKHDYKEKFEQYVGNTVILGAILCLVFATVCVIFRKWLCGLLDMTPWMLGYMFFYLLAEFSIMCFNRREKQLLRSKNIVAFTSILVTSSTITSVGLLIYGYYQKETERLLLYRIAGYYTPYILCGLVIGVVLAKQGSLRVKRENWKYGIVFSTPLIVELVSIQVMNQADKIMIKKMVGAAESGIYSLATTISYIIWIIEDSIWSAWQPWLYEKIAKNEEDDIQSYWDKMMYALGMIAAIIVLIAPEVVTIFGGAQYQEAIYCVMPLIISVLYRFFSYSFSAMENYYKQTKYVAVATILAMLINVILNYFGIKGFGYIAAAYATAFSYFILMLTQAYFEIKTTGKSIISVKKTVLVSLQIFAICILSMWTYSFPILVRYLFVFGILGIYIWQKRGWILAIVRPRN